MTEAEGSPASNPSLCRAQCTSCHKQLLWSEYLGVTSRPPCWHLQFAAQDSEGKEDP
ncbi:rCG35309 [Rattus norvegicus]|uniref:RCG35309 n=1 Tax=Rattus norvegicus TaxID=10116 RepID=A6HJP4_RAT|nr:rCG35309 [Rattus norvegicus]